MLLDEHVMGMNVCRLSAEQELCRPMRSRRSRDRTLANGMRR